MYSKDDIITLTIDDYGVDGEGIGKIEGYTIFVKDTVIGDEVRAKIIKAKKSYAYARLIEVIAPSPNRVTPVCPVARQCGGCQLQQMSYEAQLSFKSKKVYGNLTRIGELKDFEFEPIIGMDNPYNYRNKAQYPVGRDRNGDVVMGFYAGRTHSIIPCKDCAIGAKGNVHILDKIHSWMALYGIEPYDEQTGNGLVRHILIRNGYHTGEIMVCLVLNEDMMNDKQRVALKKLADELCIVVNDVGCDEVLSMTVSDTSNAEDMNDNNVVRAGNRYEDLTSVEGRIVSLMVNYNSANTNVILGNKSVCVAGKAYIEDYIGDICFRISPLSFFQVNPRQTEKLYSKALEYAELTGNETVWDMYCGIGTISLFLARNAKKVYGVEIVPEAIEDAKNNARINDIDNAEFFVGKAEEVVPEFVKNNPDVDIDVVVVDPPRKGCDEKLLRTIADMKPGRVVYVSCDSATLARDLKILAQLGYKTIRVQPVDQFPHGVHVEVVTCLQRVNS